jgi:hypothetical protein
MEWAGTEDVFSAGLDVVRWLEDVGSEQSFEDRQKMRHALQLYFQVNQRERAARFAALLVLEVAY